MHAQHYEKRHKPEGREEQMIERIFTLKHIANEKARGIKKLFLTRSELETVKKEIKVLKTAKTRYARPSQYAEVEAFLGCQVEVFDSMMEDLEDAINEKVA